MNKDDIEETNRNMVRLAKLIGYEPNEIKVLIPPPIDDFEQVVRFGWRALVGDHIYGNMIKFTIFDPPSTDEIKLVLLRSVAFYMAGVTQPEREFVRTAVIAYSKKKKDDSLLMTLIKIKIYNWWHSLFFVRWIDNWRTKRMLGDFS